MKILIGCPTLDYVLADFAMALVRLVHTRQHHRRLGERKPIQLQLCHVANSNYTDARNSICAEAIAGDYDKMLFLDSDMLFPADTIERLANHNAMIVGGTYVTRNKDGANRLLGTDLSGNALQLSSAAPLVPVRDIPAGCLMVDRRVLEKLPKPWFRFPMTDHHTLSEDTYFCHKAREAGFSILCDTKLSAELGHIGTFVYRI